MQRKIIISGKLNEFKAYPTHVCVPLGRGEVFQDWNCGLLADGEPIRSQVETAMRWPDGSVKWQHVHASLRAGVKYEYYSDRIYDGAFVSPMKVVEGVSDVLINNGLIKVVIDKAPTAGRVTISDSETDELISVGGHFLNDERGIMFSVQDDTLAQVEVEIVGPQVVCVKISGWYQTREQRVPAFVICCTRIYIFANSRIIKYDHGSTFGANMNLHGVAQMGIDFAHAEGSLYAITLVSRDIEYKFPYYITDELGKRATFWQWPGTNGIDYNDDSAIAIQNLYKNLWLHTGPLLDPRLPNEYFNAWKTQTDTTECKAEYARAANMQGLMMHANFAAIVKADDVALLMSLYKNNPIGIIEPSEACRTQVLGPIAPSEDHESPEIAEVDQWVIKAALGNEKSFQRYGDYGLFNYGNLHSEEIIAQVRPSLHRVWSNGHYGQNFLWWLLFFRSGNHDLLHFARVSTEYYASIGTVRYDEMAGKPDGTPGPETKFHVPGAKYHAKGCLPWGGRDYGMDSNDIDADLVGHWPDPTSDLLAWLIDADANAKDAYELWAENVNFSIFSASWAREANTTFVHAIYLYEYGMRADDALLTKIQAMRTSLMSIPLKDQAPGPIWTPHWLSVYCEAFPDDIMFLNWVVAQAPGVMPGIEGVWAMSLAATLTEITGDTSWIQKQASTVERATQVLFANTNWPGDPWNDFGCKPGPANDQHFMLQWPRLAAAYLKHNILDIAPIYEPGNYLWGIARLYTEWPDDMEIRGTHVFILVPSDIESFDITIDMQPLGAGDIQGCSMYVKRPDNSVALNVPRLEISAGVRKRFWRDTNWQIDREKFTIPTNGVGGIWEVVFGSDGIGLYQKLSQFPEVQKLQSLNGPKPISGEQIRHKIKHGTLYLQKTSAAVNETGLIHFSAQGEKCASRVNGEWIKPGSAISLRDPEKIEVFCDGDAWVQVEIDYNARYPFWAGSTKNDVELFSGK